MADVFIAGPVDFCDLDSLIEYRLDIRNRLQQWDHNPVNQYSELLATLPELEMDDEIDPLVVMEKSPELPSEPYLEAIRHAIAATSLETVIESPEIVARHTPDEVVADLVDRDLSLLAGSDAVLAYLPRPSCGTMTELVHADDVGVPSVLVSERPPHYARHYATEVYDSLTDGIEAIDREVKMK